MDDSKTQEDELSQVAQRLDQMETRMDELERENEQLRKENTKLRSAAASLEQTNKELLDTVEELSSSIESLEQENTLLESRLDGVCDSMDSVEDELKDTQSSTERKYADLAYRLSELEDVLDLDVVEITTSSEGNGTIIEQFASLPEEVKEDQLKESMRRATVVYEKFMEWGEFTQKGYTIKSSELRKLLSTVYDKDFQWAQVYRVMEAFDEGTPPEFEYKETEKHGKILVKYHDVTEARAEATKTVANAD